MPFRFTFRRSPWTNRVKVLLVLAFWVQAGPSTHSDDFCPLVLRFIRSKGVLSFHAVIGCSFVNITLLQGHAVTSIKSASFHPSKVPSFNSFFQLSVVASFNENYKKNWQIFKKAKHMSVCAFLKYCRLAGKNEGNEIVIWMQI